MRKRDVLAIDSKADAVLSICHAVSPVDANIPTPICPPRANLEVLGLIGGPKNLQRLRANPDRRARDIASLDFHGRVFGP
jgi:hypothetical protein